jgi:hypothetical protein
MDPERAALRRTLGNDVALAYAIECACGGKVGYQIVRAEVIGESTTVALTIYHTDRYGDTETIAQRAIAGALSTVEQRGRAILKDYATNYHQLADRAAASAAEYRRAKRAEQARAKRAAARREARERGEAPVETGSVIEQPCACGGTRGYDFDITNATYLLWHRNTEGRMRTTTSTLARLRAVENSPDDTLAAFTITAHRLDLNAAAAPRGRPLLIASPPTLASALDDLLQESADANTLDRAVAFVRRYRGGFVRDLGADAAAYVPDFATDARTCACGGGIFWGKERGRWRFRHVAPTDVAYENVAPDVVDEAEMIAAFVDKAHEEQDRQSAAARYDALVRGEQADWPDDGQSITLTVESGLAQEDGRVIAAGSSLLFRPDRPQEGDAMSIRAPSRIRDYEFVITGTLDRWSRDEAGKEIRRRGGRLDERVTLNTSALVVAKKPGKIKIADARAYGVPMLTEADLLALVAREDTIVSAERDTSRRFLGVTDTGARLYSGSAEQTLPTTPRPVARPTLAPAPVDPAVAQAQKLADLTAQARHARKRREL